jgi:hypothetical protein
MMGVHNHIEIDRELLNIATLFESFSGLVVQTFLAI